MKLQKNLEVAINNALSGSDAGAGDGNPSDLLTIIQMVLNAKLQKSTIDKTLVTGFCKTLPVRVRIVKLVHVLSDAGYESVAIPFKMMETSMDEEDNAVKLGYYRITGANGNFRFKIGVDMVTGIVTVKVLV